MQHTRLPGSIVSLAWKAATRSLQTNFIPGLLLQGLMVVMAAAYLFSSSFHAFLLSLSGLKDRSGFLFSFLGTSAASSLMPEVLRFFLPKSSPSSVEPGIFRRLLFAIPFWGLIGMQVDLFYRLQFLMFGPSDRVSVIVCKVVMDAFVYCPLLAIPQAVCVFHWKHHGFSFGGFSGWTPTRFYALRIFPVLMANWMVWIPVVSVIYSLPPALGVPFFIVAQSFWVMVFTTLSARKTHSLLA